MRQTSASAPTHTPQYQFPGGGSGARVGELTQQNTDRDILLFEHLVVDTRIQAYRLGRFFLCTCCLVRYV